MSSYMPRHGVRHSPGRIQVTADQNCGFGHWGGKRCTFARWIQPLHIPIQAIVTDRHTCRPARLVHAGLPHQRHLPAARRRGCPTCSRLPANGSRPSSPEGCAAPGSARPTGSSPGARHLVRLRAAARYRAASAQRSRNHSCSATSRWSTGRPGSCRRPYPPHDRPGQRSKCSTPLPAFDAVPSTPRNDRHRRRQTPPEYPRPTWRWNPAPQW
jgi:hypothetical protein